MSVFGVPFVCARKSSTAQLNRGEAGMDFDLRTGSLIIISASTGTGQMARMIEGGRQLQVFVWLRCALAAGPVHNLSLGVNG